MKTSITINNRRHALSIVPQTDPALAVEFDEDQFRLLVQAGMSRLQTATAAAGLVSWLWLRDTIGDASKDGWMDSGWVRVGTTRLSIRIAKSVEGFDIDHRRRIIRIQPGEPLDVARWAATACDCAWLAWNARVAARALRAA